MTGGQFPADLEWTWTAPVVEAWEASLADAGVSPELSTPGAVEYAIDLLHAVLAWTTEVIANALPASFPIELFVLGAASVVVTFALTVVWYLVHRWLMAPRPSSVVAGPELMPVPVGSVGDVGSWRLAVGERLAAGEVREALEAVWWWAARRLSVSDVQSSWTTSELLGASGRGDLRAPLGRLDRWRYGRSLPESADVERLVSELGERFE